jgi:hypothetical protein
MKCVRTIPSEGTGSLDITDLLLGLTGTTRASWRCS